VAHLQNGLDTVHQVVRKGSAKLRACLVLGVMLGDRKESAGGLEGVKRRELRRPQSTAEEKEEQGQQ
jgi:hypothetical protein